MTVREHEFLDGGVLVLDTSPSLTPSFGFEIFEVFYKISDNGRVFESMGSEYCLTSQDARELFDLRMNSKDPSKPVRPDGGAYGLVMDVLRIFLGETSMRPTPTPDTWQDMFKHVVSATTSEILTGDDNEILALYSGGDVMSRIYHAADGQEVTIPIQTVILLFSAVTTFLMFVKNLEKKVHAKNSIPARAGA
jgi:hypothetical protein